MRSDISHAAMTTDFILQASADQSELSNVRQVTQSINLQCPIYLNCSVVGYGSPAQAEAAGTGASGGCVASAKSNREPAISFGAIAGMIGLVVVRVVRSRRQAKR
jgi:hypothetical protein